MPKTLTYLLKLVGFGLILVPVCILSVSHPEPPHRQDAVDVVPYPSILMVSTSWKQPCYWVLSRVQRAQNGHYYLKSHLFRWTDSFLIKRERNRNKRESQGWFHTGCTLRLSQFYNKREAQSFPKLTQGECKISFDALGYNLQHLAGHPHPPGMIS